MSLIIRRIEEPTAEPREVVVRHSLRVGESTTGDLEAVRSEA